MSGKMKPWITQGSPQLFQASVVVIERSRQIVVVFLITNNHFKGNIGTCNTTLTRFRENPDYIILEYSATSIIRTLFIQNLDYLDLLKTCKYITMHAQRAQLMIL